MTRRIRGTGAVLAGVALISTSLPGALAAETSTVVVHDAFGAADLEQTSVNCADPTVAATTTWPAGNALGPATAPLGERSLTFRVEEPGTATGPAVHVDDPSSLSSLSALVHPSVGNLVGYAVVTHHPTDDTGYWQGLASLGTDTERGWHRIEAADRAFTWRHYDSAGALIGSAGSQTVPQFLATIGGDGEGAEVGFAYGCNGEPFYLDDFTVETAATSRAWDFEGAPSTLAAEPRRRTIPFGRRLVWDVDLSTPASFTSLPVEIEAKYAGRKATVIDEGVLTSEKSTVQTTPMRSGKYRFVLPDTDDIEGARTAWQKIRVNYVVKGDSVGRSTPQGSRFLVRGTVKPADRGTKILVQRKTSSGWTSEASTRSGSDERFSLYVPATKVGTNTYRAVAVGNALNGTDTSTPFRFTVTAPPSGGGGGGGTGGGGDGGGGGGGGGGEDPPDGPQRPTA